MKEIDPGALLKRDGRVLYGIGCADYMYISMDNDMGHGYEIVNVTPKTRRK